MKRLIYTSESLRRVQEIFDQTCDELGIRRDSAYAMASREFLAKQLFRMGGTETDPAGVRERLYAFGRRYGLGTRPVSRRQCAGASRS